MMCARILFRSCPRPNFRLGWRLLYGGLRTDGREDGLWIRRRSRSSRAVLTVRRTRPPVSRTLALSAVLLTLLLAACADGNNPTAGSGLTVGDRAPSFELPAAAGGRASLDDFVGKKSVLLYFSMGPG
jgi:hypothetical protein